MKYQIPKTRKWKKECTSLKNIIAHQQNKIILNKERVQNEKDNQDKNLELNSKFKEKLGKLFSPTQISMLWSNKSRVFAWTNDDIASAISLRSVSLKDYRYLRDKKNFPLPGIFFHQLSMLKKNRIIN